MKHYRVDTIAELKKVLDELGDDCYIEGGDDCIVVFKMFNYYKYDKQGYVIADDWRKKVIAEIEIL